MYSSSDKKLDILNDHYKDTFSHLVSYRKQRDRLLLYLLGVVMILLLYQLFPDKTVDIISTVASDKADVDLNLSDIDKILLVMIPVLIFYFIIARRYWQVWNLIEQQYNYLEKIEIELASLYASGIPFTRESKFSYKGKNLSMWSNEHYNRIFYAICSFVIPALGATFALRHSDFSWRILVITIIAVIIFFGSRMLRRLIGFLKGKSKRPDTSESN